MKQGLTLNDLYGELKKEIKKGNGNKKILLSNDDECNGFHCAYFLFTPTKNFDFSFTELPFSLTEKDAKENYIIFG